jgi:peptidoglycan/xylan/chitin deacetylase (PgdA/CDA1 family)
MAPYPRDLIGYGETPPDPQWPGGGRLAVQFVVNYEEGGENCILHGDAASEAFLSEIVGAQPWPGQRHMNMESIYEYGSRAGFWRLHRLFTRATSPSPSSASPPRCSATPRPSPPCGGPAGRSPPTA